MNKTDRKQNTQKNLCPHSAYVLMFQRPSLPEFQARFAASEVFLFSTTEAMMWSRKLGRLALFFTPAEDVEKTGGKGMPVSKGV